MQFDSRGLSVSAKSANLVFALLCLSSPAMSSELESQRDGGSPSGLLGHTIVRAYGAIIPTTPQRTLEHPGWGTGLAFSYGVTQALQLSLGLAYHEFQYLDSPDIDCDCSFSSQNAIRQTTISVELQSPTRSWLRPWVGAGFGVYEMTETREAVGYPYQYRSVATATSLGVNLGFGFSARLDQRLAIDIGGRYNGTFGEPFLATAYYHPELDLFTMLAGLSYTVH